MASLSQLGNSLYRGDVSYNIVGRRKAWYLVSAILIGSCVIQKAKI